VWTPCGTGVLPYPPSLIYPLSPIPFILNPLVDRPTSPKLAVFPLLLPSSISTPSSLCFVLLLLLLCVPKVVVLYLIGGVSVYVSPPPLFHFLVVWVSLVYVRCGCLPSDRHTHITTRPLVVLSCCGCLRWSAVFYVAHRGTPCVGGTRGFLQSGLCCFHAGE